MGEFFDLAYVESFIDIRGVVHIGAHYAEEAPEYARWAPNVLWVEAHPHYAARMYENLRNYPGQLGVEACLGSEDGRPVEFFVTSNEYASSVLEPIEEITRHDHVWVTETIALQTQRYDTMWAKLGLVASDFNFLALDTQGSELECLIGMGDLLSNFDAIQTEYSTVEMYRDGPRLSDLEAFLTDFDRVYPAMPLHHADALFVRRP